MLFFNENYDDIYNQIKYIEQHFLDCHNPNTSAIYLDAYQNMASFYSALTGINPCNKSVNRNKYVANTGNQQLNKIFKKRLNNFIKNKQNHFDMMSSSFFEIANYIDLFFLSSYYDEIKYKNVAHFGKDEGLDILFSFFDECCPFMKKLFLEYYENNQFYLLPDTMDFSNYEGATLYNPIENISAVFLKKEFNSIRFLSAIVHELAHVYDFCDYSSHSSSTNSQLYSINSSFCEVLSYYYQSKFYEYLLKNNLYKDEVLKELLGDINDLVSTMDDFLLLSCIDDDIIRNFKNHMPKDEMIKEVYMNSKELDLEFDFSNIADSYLEMVDFFSTESYSYGPLFGISMIDYPDIYDKFLMIRGSLFDNSNLQSIDITPDKTAKRMLKKCESYFGKYL